MFKNSYQSGLLSIFYSCGSHPLALWEMEVKNGHIKRITDPEVNSIVLEIVSTNVATTYITCPPNNKCLGIKLPFLVMIVKNLKRYFSFEITVLDDKNMRRRFRISNFQSTTKIKPFCTTMPIGLSGGWNQIQFNLSDFTRRAYGSQFIETLRVQVHANVRLRRIYFAERLYSEEELPQEYKLYLPLEKKGKKGKEKKEPDAAPVAPAASAPPEAPLVEEASPADLPPAMVASKSMTDKRKSVVAETRKSTMVEPKQSTTDAAPPSEVDEEKSPEGAEQGPEETTEGGPKYPAEAQEALPEGETPSEATAEAPSEVPPETEPPPETEAPPEAEAPPAEAPPEEEAPAEASAEPPAEAEG